MKNRQTTPGVLLSVLLALAPNLLAGPTTLALRFESTCIYNGSTSQTIETTFGTNLASLPFSGTTRYDFFSPALTTPTSLTIGDKASGTIYMANTSTNSADDFTVTGRMVFYDYDPATGADSQLVDTGDSVNQAVKHGNKPIGWPLPKPFLAANKIVPAGHLLHIAATISLVSGNAGNFGQFLYNGAQDSSTSALLPQNNVVAWNFAPPSIRLSLAAMSDGCKRLSCAAVPSQSYIVQAATNLAAPIWTSIGSATADGNGSFSFTDTDATNYPCRFYRLAAP